MPQIFYIGPYIVQKIRDDLPTIEVRWDAREANDPTDLVIVKTAQGSGRAHADYRRDPAVQFLSRARNKTVAGANALAVFNLFLQIEHGLTLRAPDNLAGYTDELILDRFALVQAEPVHLGVDGDEHVYSFNAKVTYFPRN